MSVRKKSRRTTSPDNFLYTKMCGILFMTMASFLTFALDGALNFIVAIIGHEVRPGSVGLAMLFLNLFFLFSHDSYTVVRLWETKFLSWTKLLQCSPLMRITNGRIIRSEEPKSLVWTKPLQCMSVYKNYELQNYPLIRIKRASPD